MVSQEEDLLALVCPFTNLPHHTLTLVLLPDLLGVPVEGRGQPLVHGEKLVVWMLEDVTQQAPVLTLACEHLGTTCCPPAHTFPT